MADPPPAQPARPGAGGERLRAPSELRRDGPLAAERDDGAAPGRDARRAAAGAQPPAAGRRATRPSTPSTRSRSPSWSRSRPRSTSCWRAHEPFPAVVVDRAWNLVAANAAVARSRRAWPSTCSSRPSNVLQARAAPRGDGAADHQPRRVARPPAPRPRGAERRRPRRALRGARAATPARRRPPRTPCSSRWTSTACASSRPGRPSRPRTTSPSPSSRSNRSSRPTRLRVERSLEVIEPIGPVPAVRSKPHINLN